MLNCKTRASDTDKHATWWASELFWSDNSLGMDGETTSLVIFNGVTSSSKSQNQEESQRLLNCSSSFINIYYYYKSCCVMDFVGQI